MENSPSGLRRTGDIRGLRVVSDGRLTNPRAVLVHRSSVGVDLSVLRWSDLHTVDWDLFLFVDPVLPIFTQDDNHFALHTSITRCKPDATGTSSSQFFDAYKDKGRILKLLHAPARPSVIITLVSRLGCSEVCSCFIDPLAQSMKPSFALWDIRIGILIRRRAFRLCGEWSRRLR